MKKIILSLFLFIYIVPSVHANWYNNHAVSYSTSPTSKICNNDGDTAGGGHTTYGHYAVANNNSSSTLIPESGSYGMPSSGSMRCLYWDNSSATISSISYTDGWSNSSTQDVEVRVADAGGSGLYRIQIRRYVNTNNPNFTGVYNLDSTQTISVSGNSDTVVATYPLSNNESYRYQVRVMDIAESEQGSSSWSAWQMGTDTTWVDRNVPDSGDITVAISPGNFLARNSQNMRVDVNSENGSNIIRVQGYFEREDSHNNYELQDSTTDNNPGNTSRLQFNWDMSRVDNDTSINNGYRDYNFRITYIEDEAGNSIGTQGSNTSSIQVYSDNGSYRTYANTLATSLSGSIISEDISNTSNIADGSAKNITIKLEDEYGNKIIPVSSIGREVNVGITVDNYIRRNQYTNTGIDSALFIGDTTTEIPVGPSASGTVSFISGTTGEYNIPFYIFSPTNNADSLVPGDASITGLQVAIDRTTTIESGDNPTMSIPIVTPISIYADSLYQSSFSGDIVDLGLIDGASQNSNISIAGSGGGARNLYLEFGGEASIDMSDMVLYATGSQLNPGDVITELQDYVSLFKNNSGYTGIHNVETLLEVSGISPDLGDLYMASVIEYTLSGKNIIYPSGIINKPAYHDAGFNGVNNQIGIKILGNTSSQNTQEIIVNQFSDDIRILGKIVKSSFRRDISQSVYGVIRNINAKTLGSLNVLSTDIDSNLWDMIKYDSGNTSSRGTAIFGDSVLYYGDGSTVRITGASDIKGEKTIVIEGADLYISGDIINADNQGILGIIVIGGSIYINPLVTDIHAILYTDKSIISSFDGINPIPINTSASQIANQLYIKGSIFSENTIGGSRNLDGLGDSDPLCPFYISGSACSTVHEAQIYDLNYLRRYFIYDSDSDGTIESNGDDNPAYGGLRSSGLGAGNALDKFPVIIDYNPAIQQTPPPFFD